MSKSGEFYHLHREFVETHDASNCPEDERATLCKECYSMINDSGKVPKFSIAAGMDYGVSERIHLPKLTVVEQYVISQECLLVSIVKLSGQQISERQSGKMGHVVVFPQEAKRLEGELERCRLSKNSVIFPRLDHVQEFISVAFIGTRAQWEAFVPLHKKFFAWGLENLQVRVDVVYLWFKALKVLHPYYRDLKIDESPERMKALEELPSQLMSNATIVSDEKEIFIDKIIQKEGSDQEINSTIDWCSNTPSWLCRLLLLQERQDLIPRALVHPLPRFMVILFVSATHFRL